MTWIKKTVYMFSSMLPSERRAKVVCSTCRKYEAKEKKQHHCRLQSRCHRECLVAAAGAGWCRCVANYPNDFLLRRFVCASFILLRVSLFGVSILLSALGIVHVVCGIHQHGYLSSLLFFFCHRQRWSARQKVEQLDFLASDTRRKWTNKTFYSHWKKKKKNKQSKDKIEGDATTIKILFLSSTAWDGFENTRSTIVYMHDYTTNFSGNSRLLWTSMTHKRPHSLIFPNTVYSFKKFMIFFRVSGSTLPKNKW